MATILSSWRRLDEARHRAELYRLWRAGASAGFTIPAALEMTGPRADPDVERLRRRLLEGARGGASLADLVMAPSADLPAFDAGLLRMGDETGRLEASLRLLAEFYARKYRTVLRVRKRLAYPLITALFAALIAPFPLLYFGHARAYVTTAGAACLLLLATGGAIVQATAARFGRQPPLVRARLARALASAVEAGLPLGRALRLAAHASADDEVIAFVSRIGERALDSRPTSETLAHCPRMSPDFLAVLANAERTGDYTNTLTRLADLYEDGFR